VTTRPPTSSSELDRRLDRLASRATAFARAPVRRKIGWLQEVRRRMFEASEAWVAAACRAKGIAMDAPVAGEEWTAGPMITLRNVRLLIRALDEIERSGAPVLEPGRIRTLPTGEVAVRTVPYDGYDNLLYRGLHAETWLAPGVAAEDVRHHQASFYGRQDPEGAVSLVLGAGNVASVPAMDVLHRMFVEGRVCMLKMSPVNDYLGSFFEHAFEPLIAAGCLEIVYGDAATGSYLCHHSNVHDIHITGSRETHDLIVWGPAGPDRDARIRKDDPLLKKPITSELGNVSPVIVVPGPYTPGELELMAQSLAGMMTNNASFNCNAARVVILPKGWAGRDALIARLAAVLEQVPPRAAYYPGAAQRYAQLAAGHGDIRRIGDATDAALPWTLVLGLDASESIEEQFRIEPFCPILSEVRVAGAEPAAFLCAAVAMANDRIPGTLNAMLFVHPAVDADPALAPAVGAAIRDLRFGTVAVNRWPAVAYASCSMPWGGHPSATLADIQSGLGWTHNTLMLGQVEKSVVRGPLAAFPKPLWFPTHRTAGALGRKLVSFEAAPGWSKLPGIVATAFRG
jgi:hypothetical protein